MFRGTLKKITTLNYAEVARIVAEVTPETNFELSSNNKCTWLNKYVYIYINSICNYQIHFCFCNRYSTITHQVFNQSDIFNAKM